MAGHRMPPGNSRPEALLCFLNVSLCSAPHAPCSPQGGGSTLLPVIPLKVSLKEDTFGRTDLREKRPGRTSPRNRAAFVLPSGMKNKIFVKCRTWWEGHGGTWPGTGTSESTGKHVSHGHLVHRPHTRCSRHLT